MTAAGPGQPPFVAGPGYGGATEAAPERTRHRWRVAFLIALAVALLVSGIIGYVDYRRHAQRQIAVVAEGTPATVPYGTITLTGIQAGSVFADASGKAVTAPEGTQIVVVSFTVTFTAKVEPPHCRVELRTSAGQELLRYGTDVQGPESDSCSAGRDETEPGSTHAFQRTFVVPEAAAKDVTVVVYPDGRQTYVRFVPHT